MKKVGLLPNSHSHEAVIIAHGKKENWESASQLFKEIMRKGISPNIHSIDAAILAFAKCGQSNEAIDLFARFRGIV